MKEKIMKVRTFTGQNCVNDDEINKFCSNHEVVQISNPVVVPVRQFGDGRGCENIILVTVVYREESSGYKLNQPETNQLSSINIF